MRDAKDLLVAIKKASIDAVESIKPVNIVFGKVTSISPLTVNIESKLQLDREQLVITDSFKKYKISCEVDGKIGTVIFDNTLKFGDNLILFRLQGGQRYLILDRVVK